MSAGAKGPYRGAAPGETSCFWCGVEGPAASQCKTCLVDRPMPADEGYLARRCPRCGDALVAMHVGAGANAHVCTRCHGIFAPPRAWTRFWQSRESASDIERRFPPPTSGRSLLELVGCSTCGREMERARFAATSNVVVDICTLGHGIWLDAGELGRALAYAEHLAGEGAVERARAAEIEGRVALERARVEGERASRQFGEGFVSAMGKRLFFKE